MLKHLFKLNIYTYAAHSFKGLYEDIIVIVLFYLMSTGHADTKDDNLLFVFFYEPGASATMQPCCVAHFRVLPAIRHYGGAH
jgi:hypothetical protein